MARFEDPTHTLAPQARLRGGAVPTRRSHERRTLHTALVPRIV